MSTQANIFQGAALVRLVTGLPGNVVTHRRYTNEVRNRERIDEGEFRVQRFGERWKAARMLRDRAWNKHRELTTVWDEEGYRLLLPKRQETYAAEIGAMVEEFNAAADVFAENYEAEIEARKAALRLVDGDIEYESVAAVRGRFVLEFRMTPIPSAIDSSWLVSGETLKAVQRQYEQRLRQIEVDVRREPYRRLVEVVEEAAAALSNPDKIFRDSLIANIGDKLGEIEGIDVGDPQLAALITQTRAQLANRAPDTFRQNPAERKAAALAASQIAAEAGKIVRKLRI